MVTFSEANLEAKVRDTLNIPTDPITDTDMATMGSLSARFSSISNLQGLEYATNLDTLFLPHNNIIDISAVAGLINLTRLSLFENDITDISVVFGLTDLVVLGLFGNDITDISAVAGLMNLTELQLDDNEISDISAIAGLTNLTKLYLGSNQIETMDLRGANLASLQIFDIENNPLTKVLLVDAALSQRTFSRLMDGGYSSIIGIAEVGGVLSLDMSRVDFGDISDFSTMYTADDLEELFLVDATNLDGSAVVLLTGELDALDWLNVAGVWDDFDATEQGLLSAWDAIVGNTLITGFMPGDANGDGRVDGSDVTILANHWQLGVDDGQIADWSMGDFNGDGQVDGSDVTILANHWQQGVGSSNAAVPEPGMVSMLLVLAGLALFRKCRRTIL